MYVNQLALLIDGYVGNCLRVFFCDCDIDTPTNVFVRNTVNLKA